MPRLDDGSATRSQGPRHLDQLPYYNNQTRLRQALALLPALAIGLPPLCAGERAPAAGFTLQRSFSARLVQASAPAIAQPRESNPAPLRTAQIDSHGRYPFGQFLGGYRYPYSYPYYRYGGPRHYPYSFGVGPYGPYGSNYGGYSGSAYDPRVYGRPLPDGAPLPDAPPAPPPVNPAPPGNIAPPARAPQNEPAEANEGPGPAVPARPIPNEGQSYGDPIPSFGASPYDQTYGRGQTFAVNPMGFYDTNMWFGQNRLIQGFGYYPMQIFNFPYGPPSGPGFYSPQYAPQYYSFDVRNYGPAYPTPGGINGGPGYYQGW